MQIPVSEAFQENERTEVSIELDPEHIRWLKDQAAQNDVSADQIVRYLINSQIRDEGDLPTGFHEVMDEEGETEQTGDSSVLDELRDASNMLDALTSDGEPTSGTGSTRTAETGSTPSPDTGATRSRDTGSRETGSRDTGSRSSGASKSPDTGPTHSPAGRSTSESEPAPESDAADSPKRSNPPSPPKAKPSDFVPDELKRSSADAGDNEDDASDDSDADDDPPSSMFEMVDDDE